MAHLIPMAMHGAGSVPDAWRFPWERGFLGIVLGNRPVLPLPSPSGVLQGAGVYERPPVESEPVAAPAVPWRSDGTFVTLRVPTPKVRWSADPNGERDLAISRWRGLVDAAGTRSKLYSQLMSANESEVDGILKDAFYTKSTATLKKRLGAMQLYLATVGRERAFPFKEEVCYQYLTRLRADGAPATRATSFLEAVGFCATLLGVHCEPDACTSARVRGAAMAAYDGKRLTKQAPPMEVELVRTLELATRLAQSAEDRELAGFATFVVHSRARASDAARAQSEPVLDIPAEGGGFVQVDTTGLRTKSGKGKRRRLRLFPMVGHAVGVSGERWAENWVTARKELGLDVSVDGCLRPSRFLRGGKVVPMGSTELMVLVRRVFASANVPVDLTVGKTSHSLRATLLSWCAKAGLPMATRRVLGGHAKPGDWSVCEYSRDALAGPLAELGTLLKKVEEGQFLPDATRSGRWNLVEVCDAPEAAIEDQSEGGETVGRDLVCKCGSCDYVDVDTTYQGLPLKRCAHCCRVFAEQTAWTEELKQNWTKFFPAPTGGGTASDADSERGPCTSPTPPLRGSDLSSSQESPAEVSDFGSDEAADFLGEEAVIDATKDDEAGETTTESEDGAHVPEGWNFDLVRHRTWFTVHAKTNAGAKLLCSRVDNGQYVAFSKRSPAWPVCRVCTARARAMARQSEKADAPTSPEAGEGTDGSIAASGGCPQEEIPTPEVSPCVVSDSSSSCASPSSEPLPASEA